MPISRDERGFLYFPDAWQVPALGLESARLVECIAELDRRKLVGVFGTRPYFSESNLDFLLQIPAVQQIELYDVKLRKVDALYELPKLKWLRLTARRPPLSFDRLGALIGLVWDYRKGDSGLERCEALAFLNSWRFKSSTGDLSELSVPSSIVELGLYWCNAQTLDGIPSLPNLKRISIERCRNLKDIRPLAKACPNLEHVVVAACGRVTSAEGEALGRELPRVRHLYAGNKVIRTAPDAA